MSLIRNSLIKSRDGDDKSLWFHLGIKDGDARFNIDGYAIVPIEEYEMLEKFYNTSKNVKEQKAEPKRRGYEFL